MTIDIAINPAISLPKLKLQPPSSSDLTVGPGHLGSGHLGQALVGQQGNQISSLTLSTQATEEPPFIEQGLKALPKMAVFEGHNKGLIMPESEKTDRMQAQLDRLATRDAKSLVDTGLLKSDPFLDFAESLSDEELQHFAQAAMALQTPPKTNGFDFGGPAKDKIEAFMQALSSMNGSQRSQVLEKAAELSQKVPVRESSSLYSASGLLSQGSIAANDIHNFTRSVNQLGDQPEQLAEFMGAFDQFSEDQLSGLLSITADNATLGLRLMDSLQGFSKESQDASIAYLAEVIANKSPVELTVLQATDPDRWSGAILGYDNHSPSVVEGMLSNIVELAENYQFTDKQWTTMMDELSDLGVADQRAYIAITVGGLDTLLGGSAGKPENVNQDSQVMDTLERLRGNSVLRETVFKSAVGEERVSDGRSFFAYKEYSDSVQDQQAMVGFLVSNAWLNQQDESHSLVLASKLGGLSAEQRDLHVAKSNDQIEDAGALANESNLRLQEDYQAFLEHSEVLRYSNDIPALTEAEESLDEGLVDKFWASGSIMGHATDEFVEVVAQASRPQQVMMLEYLDTLKDEAFEQGLSSAELQSAAQDFLQLMQGI